MNAHAANPMTNSITTIDEPAYHAFRSRVSGMRVSSRSTTHIVTPESSPSRSARLRRAPSMRRRGRWRPSRSARSPQSEWSRDQKHRGEPRPTAAPGARHTSMKKPPSAYCSTSRAAKMIRDHRCRGARTNRRERDQRSGVRLTLDVRAQHRGAGNNDSRQHANEHIAPDQRIAHSSGQHAGPRHDGAGPETPRVRLEGHVGEPAETAPHQCPAADAQRKRSTPESDPARDARATSCSGRRSR